MLKFIAEHWAEVAEPFMRKYFPGIKTHMMGGYLMFYEYPDQLNRVLEDFLSEIS